LTSVIAFRYDQRMKGSEVKRIRQALGLTQQEFADRLGVHKVTVAKWEIDAQGMRGPAVRLIALLGKGAKAERTGRATGRSGKPQAAGTRRKAEKKRP
jgi:transcriptional regulator with XRE-family HTH domain